MTRLAVAAAMTMFTIGLAGCGASIPLHSGYKSKTAKPWKKAKAIELDAHFEGKTDGDLDYGDYRRAKWLAVDLPADGELQLDLEASPTPPADDEDFDLALEVLDPDNRVITKADLDEDDAHELTKTRTLYELTPGRYLIHLYLQRRTDRTEWDLKVHFTPTAPSDASNPVEVAFLPRLPIVPLDDDTPITARPKPKPEPTHGGGHGKPKPKPEPTDPEPTGAAGPISGTIINVSVVGDGTQITFNRGTDAGVKAGMRGSVTGAKQGSFTVDSCGARSCKAVVKATPDEVSRSGKVVVGP